MVEVLVNYAPPPPPPKLTVASITISLSPAEARVIYALLALSTSRFAEEVVGIKKEDGNVCYQMFNKLDLTLPAECRKINTHHHYSIERQ